MSDIKGPSDQPKGSPPLSRTRAKRLFNLHKSTINTMTDGKQRALEDASAELQRMRTMLANACAVLEAVVRRHGTQVFDRQSIESICAKGRIAWIVNGDRIGVKLRDEPQLVESVVEPIDVA